MSYGDAKFETAERKIENLGYNFKQAHRLGTDFNSVVVMGYKGVCFDEATEWLVATYRSRNRLLKNLRSFKNGEQAESYFDEVQEKGIDAVNRVDSEFEVVNV